MLKWVGMFFSKDHLLRSQGSLSLLNSIWAFTLSQLPKLPPRKLESWFVLRSFFLQGLLCTSLTLPYDLAGHRTVGHSAVVPSLSASLESLVHHPNAASLSLIYRYYFGRYSSELAELVPLTLMEGLLVIQTDGMIFLLSFLDSILLPFLSHTARLWNFLHRKCFSWHPLSARSF